MRMWMLDIAREQNFSIDALRGFCRMTLDSGYDAIGLYLEHRFAYPSAPWAHGVGALRPEAVRQLEREFPDLAIVPFANLLGHFEGMLYTEEGKQFREARFDGMQACPSNPEFTAFCRQILADILATFSSELIHIGGDETWQLGQCEVCAARVEDGKRQGFDGKAELYGRHFGPLAEELAAQGRRPAVWGDMFLEHPDALEHLPAETVVFDWQYFGGVRGTAPKFADRGFDVVGCPTLQTYNAAWMHLEESEANVREVAEDVASLGLAGVCVTTWECGLFGSYGTVIPAIRGCGALLAGEGTPLADAYGEEAEWARLMGIELKSAGGLFAHSTRRSSLKSRLLMQSNPFLLWLHHADELCGAAGDRAIEISRQALAAARTSTTRGIAEFVLLGVEFARHAEAARRAYADRNPGRAAAKVAPCRQIFEQLERIARANALNEGGSLADIERCRIAREHVERVLKRIRDYGDGSLGYLPSFEHLSHPKFVPHDQAAWWLINRWANE